MSGPGRHEGEADAHSNLGGLDQHAESTGGAAPGREPHVLVVDDHALNRYLVRTALARLRWQVSQAGDGRQALEMIRAGERYDLVLMDMDMPVLDGLAATRLIRAWEEAQLRPPLTIMAFSANVDRDAERQCLAAGMNGFIAKPTDMVVLPQLLLQKLRASRRD